ncbi:MAG: hypothetical protein NVSMB27_17180 [Ktedonobacteraceae bacterium]
MNRGVATIWWGMLIATCLGVVPIAVVLLNRTLNAARNIERYTEEMLNSGVGIANNTANVAALKDTISAAPQLVGGAESLALHITAIEHVLAANASNNGQGKEKGEPS